MLRQYMVHTSRSISHYLHGVWPHRWYHCTVAHEQPRRRKRQHSRGGFLCICRTRPMFLTSCSV